MRKNFCTKCKKCTKLKKNCSNANICSKMLVISPSCQMYDSENYKVSKKEKFIDVLEILRLIIHTNE